MFLGIIREQAATNCLLGIESKNMLPYGGVTAILHT